jgi:hypothetical protein
MLGDKTRTGRSPRTAGSKERPSGFAGIPPKTLSSPSSPLPQEKKSILKKKPLRPKPGPDHPWRKDFKKKFTHKKYSSTDIFKEHLT